MTTEDRIKLLTQAMITIHELMQNESDSITETKYHKIWCSLYDERQVLRRQKPQFK